MKFVGALALAIAADGVSGYVVGHPSPQNRAAAALAEVLIRSTPANQPNGYGPTIAQCPSNPPTIRSATGLSSQEQSWLNRRRPNTLSAMMDLLNRANITGFNATQYINSHSNNVSALPNIGIAASGGGYRAMLNGGGVIAAFDSRSPNSTAQGQLGGLLQSATYFAGLSGGSWLVGSIYGNNFTTIQNLQSGAGNSGTWDFSNSILEGPDRGFQLLTTADYYKNLFDQVEDKSQEGFNTTLTDYWGRALSYQLINATDGGPAYTFSSIATQDFFTNGNVPMPIIIADGRAPGEVLIASNTTIFEFNTFEMGTWDNSVYAFAPMQYIGTNFSNGNVVDQARCVTGYDNIGYTFGTSSTLFNQIVLQFNSTVNLPSFLENGIQSALNKFGQSNNDIASYVNPFVGIHPATNLGAESAELTLVDGGEDGQNIPLHPLIQPVRNVDVIFAIDSSADINGWPNGTSLVATYERSQSPIANGTRFPAVPSTNTFVNLGLNKRPTFFGCNATGPLVIYLPNAPYSYHSNVSTYDLSYSDSERDSIIQNGYNVATRGNSSTEMWPTCVGCAIMARSWNRTNTAIPAVCNTCFTSYCWNGTTNNTTPNSYMPAYIVPSAAAAAAKSGASDGVVPKVGMVVAAAVMAAFALLV